jgi:hypothetical protein
VRRTFPALLSALAALVTCAGCGGSTGGTPAAGTANANQATILVTENCGKQVVVARSAVPAGRTAMQALQQVAKIDTASGGKFVTAIDGHAQDVKKKLAWLYYVNGKAAQKGASEVKLRPGDVEWWDLHNYTKKCTAPAMAK